MDTVLKIGSSSNQVDIHPFGATVIGWKYNNVDLLFLSSKAITDGSKAIRGGIPICFPQFGPWTAGPQHGFARSKPWKLTKKDDNTAVAILQHDDETLKLWPYNFEFIYTIKVLEDKKLSFQMEVHNKSEKEFDFTFCFHTYFNVPDVKKCAIEGLKDLEYIDKVKGGAKTNESRPKVTISDSTDSIYLSAPDVITLHGAQNGHSIQIKKSGIKDVVVWNPWIENAKKMSDFGDEGYTNMVCVEPANAIDRVVIKPESSWVGKVELEVV
ncbi:E5.1.3.15 [Lepeophtheirus salmonis]|uniref:glucose-6-phosphate 1-epimerase n=1 Tax=Lepeophtheirus salmonis TaxID=72036 RepID=A0A7R8H359_LEPSM|nr:E5.1.3.15 [Lepeophtheirus salmonis]CAF2837133.1 E5.1.3.15 [Lepeophtheirus salmonis]